MAQQKKQSEWAYQWGHLSDDSQFLFKEWIYPNAISDFKGKTVLDAGCGGGQHSRFAAKYAKKVVGVDLNTKEIAKKKTKFKNIRFVEGDIAKINLHKQFDIVYSIGVLQHTDNPTKSFQNIKKHLKKNGRMMTWVYSREGNFLNRTFLEFFKRIFFLRIPKNILMILSYMITSLMYLPIYTIYLLPLKFLPFYYYFQNWRKLSFYRNNLNVFDKLNAPQTFFISRKTIEEWYNPKDFRKVHISHYKGVSWRASGTKN